MKHGGDPGHFFFFLRRPAGAVLTTIGIGIDKELLGWISVSDPVKNRPRSERLALLQKEGLPRHYGHR